MLSAALTYSPGYRALPVETCEERAVLTNDG
jgi:hypothetical protein